MGRGSRPCESVHVCAFGGGLCICVYVCMFVYICTCMCIGGIYCICVDMGALVSSGNLGSRREVKKVMKDVVNTRRYTVMKRKIKRSYH